MILISQFRPPCLSGEEFPARRHGLALALACHKGSASQAQSSSQTGAQGSGVASSGTNSPVQTTSNAGTQQHTGITITPGSGGGTNSAASPVNAIVVGEHGTYESTVSDLGAVALSFQAIRDALTNSQAFEADALKQVQQATLNAASATYDKLHPDGVMTQTPMHDTAGPAATGTGATGGNKTWLVGAAGAGLVWYLFFRSKRP